MTTCVDGSWIGGSHAEYRGTSMRGVDLYVPRPSGLGQPGVALGDLANDMGMTTWAYDTWFRYLAGLRELGIHEVCGERFELESADWWRDWIMRVSTRQGLGNDYAEGLATILR